MRIKKWNIIQIIRVMRNETEIGLQIKMIFLIKRVQQLTYVAEDHGLCDGEGAVQITECCELVLLVLTEDVELLDGVQCLLFALQPDDVWIWHNSLCKPPHRFLKSCREEEHLTVLGQPSACVRKNRGDQ